MKASEHIWVVSVNMNLLSVYLMIIYYVYYVQPFWKAQGILWLKTKEDKTKTMVLKSRSRDK